jgi:outer membrane protein OmpA-like peptidoglycan-associated protein
MVFEATAFRRCEPSLSGKIQKQMPNIKRELKAMLNKKKIQFYLSIISMLCISLYPAVILCETSCTRAEALFQKSLIQGNVIDEKTILRQIVSMCPQHAEAWNNLGAVYEKEGNLGQAENAYRLAHEHKPELGIPLAGLGDVALNQGRYQDAINWYQAFLTFLANELKKGDPRGIGIYEDEYREKYDRAKMKLKILTDSMSGVVPKDVLTRGLQIVSPQKESERLSLFIYFGFDSAELKPQGQSQLIEVAKAMLVPEHQDSAFLIEGHTDTLGPDQYNLDLSKRRAEKVRTFLASQGIMSDRLRVIGIGETRPLVLKGGKNEQAINRRVEFVSLGISGK